MLVARPAPQALALALLAAAPTAAQQHSTLPVDASPDGDAPVGLAYTADGASVVVAHRDSGDVTFFDATTLALQATVAVGDEPEDLALTPDGQRVLTPDWGSGTLTVVDVPTRTVVASIPLTGAHPARVAVSSDSRWAYVALDEGWKQPGEVAVVDLAALAQVSSFPIGSIFRGYQDFLVRGPDRQYRQFGPIALTPDDATLLVVEDLFVVAAYDVATGSPVGSASTTMIVVSMAVAPDGSFAAVGGHAIDVTRVEVIDLTSFQVQHSVVVNLFDPPYAIAVSPDSRYVFAGHAWVTRYGVFDQSVVHQGFDARDLTLSHDGSELIATGWGSVAVYSTGSFETLARMTVPDGRFVAAHPTTFEAAAVGRHALEALHRVRTNGKGSALLASRPTGPPPEGDGPARVALDGAGHLALAANRLSWTASAVDLIEGAVRSWIALPAEPLGIEVTPDGRSGVVGLPNEELGVLDLEAGALAARLPVGAYPVSLATTGDGSEAQVMDIEGVLHFVRLAGAASAEVGSLALAPEYGLDGEDLRLARSARDVLAIALPTGELALVDAVGHALLKQWVVDPQYPQARPGAFDPAGDFLYLHSRGGGPILKVREDGANSALVGASAPLSDSLLAVGRDGQFVYSATNQEGQPLRVIDTSNMFVVLHVPLQPRLAPEWMERAGVHVLLGTVDVDTLEQVVLRFAADGLATALEEAVRLPAGTQPGRVAAGTGRLVAPNPAADALELVDYALQGTPYCGPAVPNSSGLPARIAAEGWLTAGDPLWLSAVDLPPNHPGYFLVADAPGFVAQPPGSQGNLCLGGAIGRLRDALLDSGSQGAFARAVATDALPLTPPVGVQPGETWYFQAWFRDDNPGPTSNFTDGVAVTFE